VTSEDSGSERRGWYTRTARAWGLLALLALEPAAALAQDADTVSSGRPIESAPDTTSHDADGGPAILGLALGAALGILAPPAILFIAGEDGSVAATGSRRLSVDVGGGVAFGLGADEETGWAGSVVARFEANGLYGEIGYQDLRVGTRLQYQAMRVGYLWRPASSMAGGIALGYRRSLGAARDDGFEIGLPLVQRSGSGVLRMEATYLRTSDGVFWGHRLEAHGELPRLRLRAGVGWSLIAVGPEDDVFTLSLFAGWIPL